jgi:hypothetical protein
MEQVDPVLGMMSRLEQALRQAETGALATGTWDSLYSDEVALEDALVEQAEARTAVADFGGAAQAWASVAGFNERLSSIIGFMIGDSPADETDNERLITDRNACTRLGAFARAQAALVTAIRYRLGGNYSEAETAATEAQQRFDALARDGGADDSIMASMADALRLGIIAGAKQLRFQYQEASVTYLQAQRVLEKVRARLVQSRDTSAAALAGVLSDIYEYKSAAERALLLKAVVDGDFEKAVTHADAIMQVAPPPDNGVLPTWITQSAELNYCNAAAYLAYARAELAANGRNWDEAERQLADAEKQWRQLVAIAIDMDIPQSRQAAEIAQAISAQTVGTTRRRIQRERALYAQIAAIQAENRQLQDQIYQLAKEPRFGGGMSSDTYNIRKSQSASIGPGGVVNQPHLEQANTGNALAGFDMPALAGQLEELISELRKSAAEPAQYQALAEVSQAAQAAREQDKATTAQHLKQAGRWVLAIAEKVGVPLAVSALKAALGLPAM